GRGARGRGGDERQRDGGGGGQTLEAAHPSRAAIDDDVHIILLSRESWFACWREGSNRSARALVRGGTLISPAPVGTWKMSRGRWGRRGPAGRQGADGLSKMLDSRGEDAMGLLVSIIIGGIIGWIATLIMRTDAQIGILGNILIGIVGSGLGHVLAGMGRRAAHVWAAGARPCLVGALGPVRRPPACR